MNRVWSILLIFIFAVTFCGCSATEDENADQREDIVSYLESTHSPALVSLSEAQESLDENLEFYVTTGATTFRYIEDYYNEERESRTTIQKWSTIEITISIYDFYNTTTPSISTILYSNDAEVITDLETEYEWFNSTYWSSDPLTIKVGEGTLFSGVETLLVGCKEGDKIEFYMTLDEAYGTSVIGVSTEESPLALFCEVLAVK